MPLAAPHATSPTLLTFHRLPEHTPDFYEMKDPSIVRVASGEYQLYSSIGNSQNQTWKIGRFTADSLTGPWHELGSVEINGLTGPQVCAPAMRYEQRGSEELWTMYVQSACFEDNSYLAIATSSDGQHFTAAPSPLITKHHLGPDAAQVIGVYDAGISRVLINGEEHHCLTFSGYRRIGCGDVYMTYAASTSDNLDWASPQRILAQEDVPFHNHPSYEWFEWGLEGAQIIQLHETSFLMVGVCFLPRPDGHLGTRQRVFFAHAASLLGPFVPITTPLEPTSFAKTGQGENGHPDAVLEGDVLTMIYQERAGHGQPWHLRHCSYSVAELEAYFAAFYRSEVAASRITANVSEWGNRRHVSSST